MRNNKHIPLTIALNLFPNERRMMYLAYLSYQRVHAPRDIFRALAARASIRPDIPGSLAALADLSGRDALVVAVVPFPDLLGYRDGCGGVACSSLLVRIL